MCVCCRGAGANDPPIGCCLVAHRAPSTYARELLSILAMKRAYRTQKYLQNYAVHHRDLPLSACILSHRHPIFPGHKHASYHEKAALPYGFTPSSVVMTTWIANSSAAAVPSGCPSYIVSFFLQRPHHTAIPCVATASTAPRSFRHTSYAFFSFLHILRCVAPLLLCQTNNGRKQEETSDGGAPTKRP